MANVSAKGIYKHYPGGVTAVSDFTMDIRDKEFIVFVGPSGCGKSTTLRMIAGLEDISEGELFIGGRLVNDVAPKDRDIAMVFQNYALYPHMSVFDNLAFGLKVRKVPKDEIKKLVEGTAKILDIAHLLDRKPKALSGGQKQRVALGRAIVRDPKVFLLDEPLSNLDAKLRVQMRIEIAKLHKKLGTTFIYVTHDQSEAMTMGDRIVVMKEGVIQQIDSPANLYDSPANKFVAGFIGAPMMNFIDAKLVGSSDKYSVEFGKDVKYHVELPSSKSDNENLKNYIDKDIILGVRPENIHDEEMYLSAARTGIIEASVDVTETLGADTYIYLTCQGIPLTARVSSRTNVSPNEVIRLALDPNKIHLFDPATEKSLLN